MDAKIFGTFIAACRKEKNLTQAELAAKLNVTDKAVSRWERGIGFPDINTIEPLAEALEISVPELMKSKRITEKEITEKEVADIVSDTLEIAKLQRRQERRNVLTVLGIVCLAAVFLLFLDSADWRLDYLIFETVGVLFPLLCVFGFFALLASGIWRKIKGKPWGQTVIAAAILLLLFLILMGAFFLIGILGIGPVSS